MTHPGPQISYMRESLNLSINQLANIVHLSPQFIASIEDTTFNPHPLTTHKITTALRQLGATPLHAIPHSHTIPTIIATLLSILISILWLLILVIASDILKWV